MHRRPKPHAREGLSAVRVVVDGQEYAILSMPLSSVVDGEGLTSSEKQVAQLAIAGFSNADIARLRGSSVRTVANQLASVYRKMKVESRSDLAALGALRSDSAPAIARDD